MRRPLALQAAAAKEVVAPRPLGDDQLAFIALRLQARSDATRKNGTSWVIGSPPPDPDNPVALGLHVIAMDEPQ